VLRVHKSLGPEGSRVSLSSGRRVVYTPEHMHFPPGYLLGPTTPQQNMTYLMWGADTVFRSARRARYTGRSQKPVFGPALRGNQDHGGASGWSDRTSEPTRRYKEACSAARYGDTDVQFDRPQFRTRG